MKNIARILRQSATQSEQLLWGCLRKNRVMELSFRRQHTIGPYIVDFCCFDAKLIIEIDGSAHDHPERIEKDEIREKYLEQVGFRVIRFTAWDVEQNLEGVLLEIQRFLKAYPPP